MTGVFIRRRFHVKTETQGEHHVTTETEIAVIQLQAKKCQGLQPPPEAEKCEEGFY